MSKKYSMNEYWLQQTFNKFKDEEPIQKALELGWLIYLRENGYLTLNPNITLPKTKMAKIEKNYCLYQ